MSITEVSIPAAGPLLLTVEQAAHQFGIGRTTVFALLKSGELESIPLGRLRRIPAECITSTSIDSGPQPAEQPSRLGGSPNGEGKEASQEP